MNRPTLPAQASPPQVALSGLPVHAIVGAEVVAIPVLAPESSPGDEVSDVVLGPGAADLSEHLGLDLMAHAEALEASAKVGHLVTIAVPLGGPDNADLRAVVLVGVGQATPDELRRAAAALVRATCGRAALATTIAALDADHGVEAVVAGLMLGSFSFSWHSTAPDRPPLRKAVLTALPDADTSSAQQRLAKAVAIGGAGWRSRFLATVPSNLKDPAWVVDAAREVADEAGLEIRVWDDAELRAGGFGGIVGVGQGSASPPALVRLDYTPAKASRRTPTVALVGKGITFDTGGYSIKPAEGMTTMKRDMTGAAVVLATMAALADVGCPVKVVGFLALAENSVSGSAMRPGDVITHYGGRTTEVTNTDAEGRLVLADAMAYAVEHVKPDALIDVATLTGGIKVGLGQQLGGLFATDDALAQALLAAGAQSGEPLWRMPLHAGYEDLLPSKVADANNSPTGPQPVMAAMFLQHFTGGLPWAHLDLASVGDAATDAFEWTSGPTGFGPRLLLTWLGSERPTEGVGV